MADYSRIQESEGAYCNTPVQESGVKLACVLHKSGNRCIIRADAESFCDK
ncbi:hypothetical protein [Trichormus sp. NMC-1]|nr:hypothetical protein [Trichormus sp. NMC-1]